MGEMDKMVRIHILHKVPLKSVVSQSIVVPTSTSNPSNTPTGSDPFIDRISDFISTYELHSIENALQAELGLHEYH